MQSPGAIRQKLKQVKWRYLKKLLTAKLAQRPPNCIHNGQLDIPENGAAAQAGVHICTLKLDDGSWNGGVCDEGHGGLQRAQQCPHFQARHSKDAIKDEFNRFFETANYGEIAYLYPMAAALIWVLDGEVDEQDDEESEEVPPEEPSETPQVPAQATLDKLSGPDEDVESDEVLAAVEALREQLPGMVAEAVNGQMKDMSDRVGDLSTSTVNSIREIKGRLEALEAQPPAKIGWWDRLLGRGLDG